MIVATAADPATMASGATAVAIAGGLIGTTAPSPPPRRCLQRHRRYRGLLACGCDLLHPCCDPCCRRCSSTRAHRCCPSRDLAITLRSMKDLATQSVITRYNSSGPLYTLHLPTSTTSTLDVVSYALAAATSSSTWHHHLGHPGSNVLTKISCSSVITCPLATDDSLCRTCQLGWRITLSYSRVVRPFDLIHYDLWTSSIISVSNYKYYLVILDDCIHCSCTSPLRYKSDTFSTLSLLRLCVHTIWLHHLECLVR
jgi:hypothetical protein